VVQGNFKKLPQQIRAFCLTETWKTSFSFTTMPDLTPACARVRQSQKWDGLFFPIQLRAQIWHPPTVTCLAWEECTTWTPFCRWQQIETKFSWCALKSRHGILQRWYKGSYPTLAKCVEMTGTSCKIGS
jgi:hypothetical protein